MKVLGITGGVGSGKSEVLTYLEEAYGAVVCQMDKVAQELEKKGTPCFQKIVETFGAEMIGADGELDRRKLGALVFADGEKLALLNRIVHPAVLEWVRQDIEEKEEEGKQLYVVEAALLPEVGGEICGEIWYIYADPQVRRERLKASRGYSDEKIADMIRSQPSEEAFRRISTAVIDNSGSLENTKRQIGDRL
ncbi:dephospho-CoA kinase [Lachnoclostridium sp. An169]|uniref:dephospho-CoA kinase n=1 Tax=Lachnoclostridium sp. An169 TaxID=1965569 RepID=UPI000B3788DF|nr:dephospho-CoA kinase [Lachnoclostridium sp. An169]OUP86636.1 dephospho-CoA kinase [Lachnoclostridium sp. An169]